MPPRDGRHGEGIMMIRRSDKKREARFLFFSIHGISKELLEGLQSEVAKTDVSYDYEQKNIVSS